MHQPLSLVSDRTTDRFGVPWTQARQVCTVAWFSWSIETVRSVGGVEAGAGS
jgi:hypothetical protein